MARHPRIQFPGAIYHIINRGNYRFPILLDPRTAEILELLIFETARRYGWRILAFVIMSNHFHLVVETPRPNLAAGMHWLETTFCVRFNRHREEHGHVFQGRYKALPIEPGPWLARVVDYVHLNPVRAGIVTVEQLDHHARGSFRRFVHGLRPDCLSCLPWLKELGLEDRRSGWDKYRQYLAWFAEKPESRRKEDLAPLTTGWAIGSPTWKREIRRRYKHLLGRHRLTGPALQELKTSEWAEALDALLERSGRTREEAAADRKGAPWKIELAWTLRHTTTATNAWIARELHMGSPASVSVYLCARGRIED